MCMLVGFAAQAHFGVTQMDLSQLDLPAYLPAKEAPGLPGRRIGVLGPLARSEWL